MYWYSDDARHAVFLFLLITDMHFFNVVVSPLPHIPHNSMIQLIYSLYY